MTAETPEQRKRRLAREITAITAVGSDSGECQGCGTYSVNAHGRIVGSGVVCDSCASNPAGHLPLTETGRRGGA